MNRALGLAAWLALGASVATPARAQDQRAAADVALDRQLQEFERAGAHEPWRLLCERALSQAEAARDTASIATSLYWRGRLRIELAELPAAFADLDRARALVEQHADLARVARVHAAMSQLAGKRGNLHAARFHAQVACDAFLLGQRHANAATVLAELGLTESGVGSPNEAVRLYELARFVQRERGDQIAESRTLSLLASGDTEGATSSFAAAEEIARRLGQAPALRHARIGLALAAANSGRLGEARDLYEPLLAQSEATGVPDRDLAAALGAVLGELGDHQGALRVLTRTRDLLDQRGNPVRAAGVRLNLAALLYRIGDLDAALAEARLAMRAHVNAAEGLGERDGLEARRNVRDAAASALITLHAMCAHDFDGDADESKRDSRAAAAFWFVEQSRAVLLSEALVNRTALLNEHAPRDLIAAEADAHARLLEARAVAQTSAVDAGLAKRARSELEAADACYGAAHSRVERALRSTGRLLRPPEPDLARLRRMLDDGTVFVSYARCEHEWYAFAATRDRQALCNLGPVGPIDQKLVAWQRLLAQSSPDAQALTRADEQKLAAELYELLLRPFEKTSRGKTRWLVSPDAGLAFTPFEALVRGQREQAQRLVERAEIAYVPSGTVYAVLREASAKAAKGDGLLALGDPRYPRTRDAIASAQVARDLTRRGIDDLEPLPHSAAEVAEIATLFGKAASRNLLGPDASIARLTQELRAPGRRKAIHFACHAHIDPERPSLCALLLSGGELLTLDAIQRLPLAADLVVLSACATTQGKHADGEGVLGFVRGIFLAGAPRVLATEWPVRDAASRELVVAFYERWLKDGMAPGAALRAVKLARLARGEPPQAWAGFVLWGLPE